MATISIAGEAWLKAPETQAVLKALLADGGDARFVGGCVRNALLGVPVEDIDIATPLMPDEVMRRTIAAGLRAVATGIEHGTVTAISGHKPFEITTLRRDVSTDGRRATVAFTSDWEEDAKRRDFTMNALYADAKGEIFDFTTGVEDLRARRVRFIGEARERIAEDHLRILRLFRFHAWYGRGDLDAKDLAACTEARAQIKALSSERIQKEMLRLFAAEQAAAVVQIMARAGILEQVLPAPLRFDRLERLCATDRAQSFAADALLRLGALLGREEQANEVAQDWRLSNADRARLSEMTEAPFDPAPGLEGRETRKILYRHGAQRFHDRVRLRWAEEAGGANDARWLELLDLAGKWQRPVFPLKGSHAMEAGVPQGPLVRRVLSEVEEWWIENDFAPGLPKLAKRLEQAVRAAAK